MRNVENVNINKSLINSTLCSWGLKKEQTKLSKKERKKQILGKLIEENVSPSSRYLTVPNAMKGQSREELTSDHLPCLL